MTVNVVSQGEVAFLTLIVAPTMDLRLYVNDVTGDLSAAQIEDLDEGDFTEASFTGYSSKSLTSGNWVVTEGTPSDATYPEQTFSCTGTAAAQIVYGYYVERNSDGALMWFEEFPNGPYVVAISGQSIAFAPTITLD